MPRPQSQSDRRRFRLLLWLAVALFLIIVTVAPAVRLALSPLPLAEAVTVVIPPGTGARETAALLQRHGVVRSATAIRLLALVRGQTRDLRAGEYRFTGENTPATVLDRLVRGEILLHEVTIPEGLTRRQTVALLKDSGIDIRGDLDAASRRFELIADLDPQARDLEGYLFPETYRFPRQVEADVVVAGMVRRFRRVAGELSDVAGGDPTILRAWVTLASLVEKETGRVEERARVAAVFAHRLRRGMLLQCDPTVIYALDLIGQAQTEPLAHYLDMDHPYNTYRHTGLPPGPIANPGAAALAVSLAPPATDDLYFVADGRGGHRFSRTLKEHNEAVRAWRQHLRTQQDQAAAARKAQP